MLADELGVDPGPEVRRLEAAILVQDPALASERRRHRRVSAPDAVFRPERELATLLDIWRTLGGPGRVTFVSGEPGIGKSRLLVELAERAATRAHRCSSGGVWRAPERCRFTRSSRRSRRSWTVGPPPGVLGHLLHDGRTQGGRALQPDELRLRLLDGMARFLVGCGAERPVLLVVDDLHWADEGTVAMLRHVARSTPGHRLLVVGAYRGSEVSDRHQLADALGALRSEAECSVLRVAGLDRAAIARVMRATAGAPVAADLVDAVHAETHGNPFFTREIVQHLREAGALHGGPDGALRAPMPLVAVPEGVRHVIAHRRRRLTGITNRLLDLAATVEGPFLFEPVRDAAGLSDADGLAALDEALQAALVVPDPVADRYDFTHAIVRHTVYQELNPSRRLRLHRDVAAALAAARAAGARISAAEVAIQYHHAASLPGAAAGVGPALEAADRAGAAGAHDEQATFLQIACDLLPPDDERHADLLGRRAVALGWALRFDDAVAAARAASEAGSGTAIVADVATVLATAGSNTHAWQLAAAAVDHRTGPEDGDPQTWAALTLLDLDRREAADPSHPGMPLDLPGRRAALRILHESGGSPVAETWLATPSPPSTAAVTAFPPATPRTRRSRRSCSATTPPPSHCSPRRPTSPRRTASSRGPCTAARARPAARSRSATLAEGAAALEHTRRLAARLPGLALGWQLLHHQGAEDALAMALDEGWPERMAGFAPWMAPGPDRHWGMAGIAGIAARVAGAHGPYRAALPLLAGPVRALSLAPAWAPNYTRTACEVAETLWLLDRRDHLVVVERALRDKALPADFRFPMTDARLALARLCALDGRTDEARRWFDAARAVLDAQGARPLRAVVDHDEALMHRGPATRPRRRRTSPPRGRPSTGSG